MVSRALVLALFTVGCGPLLPSDDVSGDSGSTTGTQTLPDPDSTSTTAGPAVTTGRTTGMATTQGAEDGTTSVVPPESTGSRGDDTNDSIGASFITDPDGGGGGVCFFPSEGVAFHTTVCSYFDQDCARGEVCKPADNCGAGTWSQPTCRAAVPGADGQPGDPCTIEESPYSGFDTCAPDSMCFDVDPVTLEGTCAQYCSQSVTCDAPSHTCFEGNDNWVPVCLPRCSPVLGDCPSGQGCYPGTDDDFVCITESLPLYTDPSTLHPACPPGSFMATEAELGTCPDEGPCCASFCDLSAPNCGDGLVCVPFFEDLEGVDPADHDVGYCAPDPG